MNIFSSRRLLACRTSINLFLLLRTPITLLLLLIFSTCSFTNAQDAKAMIYLASYGYLPPSVKNPASGNLLSEETFTSALKDFQRFAGINETGEMNEETIQLMGMPRCGVKDKVGYGADARSKRYTLQGSRWRVKNLTYKISKYPKLLGKEKVDREVQRAFAVWSEYTDLTFKQQNSGSVHIEIRFEKLEHGDGDPFDGPGGTLAHAYFPVYGGDAHFDDDEVWTIDTNRGTNLFQVAAHEFGHSLGLSHSDEKRALMAPFYRGYQPYFELDRDDIQGIQILYGKKTTSGAATTESVNSISGTDDPVLCKNGAIDTIFSSNNGAGDVTYVFKGDKYWRLDKDKVNPDYPKPISEGWPRLPSNIDAAFTYKNGKTYFFKGSQYWRYVKRKMDGDYPKPISEGFKGIPNNLDAALVWTGNGKIYFFKGDKFWRFDPSQSPPVKDTYPKPISNWEGVPANIDAALQYTNGYTYFFKKGAYWRFNDRSFTVDAADPAFPRSTAYWWYGCKDASKSTLGNLSNNYQSDVGSSEQGDHDYDNGHSVYDPILDAATTQIVPREKVPMDPVPEMAKGSAALVTGSSTVLLVLLLISQTFS